MDAKILDNLFKVDRFTQAYLIAALWAELDDNEEPFDRNYDLSDFSPEAVIQALTDCLDFQKRNAIILENLDVEQCGHNFWMTRKGHGSGFWDEEGLGKLGDDLTKACEKYGDITLYVGEDKQLHFE